MAIRLRFLPAAIAAAVALLIAYISIRSFAAAWVALPAGGTIEGLRAGQEATAAQIGLAAQASHRAGQIFEPGRYYSDAALAAGRLTEAERRAALDGMPLPELVDQALMASPASPYNWARRAGLQLARKDYDGARRSLETSLMFGRFVPGLTAPRLRILYALMQRRSDRQLDTYFEEQVRIAASSEPMALAAFAAGGGPEGRTQRLLSTDYTLYKAYLEQLIEYRKQQAYARASK